MSQITSLVISETIPATGLPSFTKNIHLPFKPDIIKVSHVFYYSPTGDAAVHRLTSDLISSIDGCIQNVFDATQYSEPMLFSNDKTISGTYNFNFDNGPLAGGIFTMTITFIKN